MTRITDAFGAESAGSIDFEFLDRERTDVRRVWSVVLVIVIVLATIPTGVAAQGSPSPLLLNQQTERMGRVTIDGDEYVIYRYDNMFASVSGIAIYTNGEKVTSTGTASEVFTRLAKRRAIADIGQDDLEILRQLRHEIDSLANLTGSTLTSTERTLEAFQKLKEVHVNGTTAWKESVASIPALTKFNATAHEFLSNLRDLSRRANDVSKRTGKFITFLEDYRKGSHAPPRELYRRYTTIRAELVAFESGIGRDDFGYIDSTAKNLAELSEKIAANVSALPEAGSTIERRLRTLANRLRSLAKRVEAIETAGRNVLPVESLPSLDTRVDELRSRWMEGWRSRRNAAIDLYGRFAVIGIAAIAVGGITKRRFL